MDWFLKVSESGSQESDSPSHMLCLLSASFPTEAEFSLDRLPCLCEHFSYSAESIFGEGRAVFPCPKPPFSPLGGASQHFGTFLLKPLSLMVH